MPQITLSLGDIYALEVEIAGAKNPQTGEVQFKGLLNQELSLVTKFKLSEIKDRVSTHKKNVDTLREELIKKLGEEDKKSGGITLPTFIDKLDKKGKPVKNKEDQTEKEVNPNFIEFNKEMEKLLAETKEIKLPLLKIEDFDIKTDETYEVFFKALGLALNAETAK